MENRWGYQGGELNSRTLLCLAFEGGSRDVWINAANWTSRMIAIFSELRQSTTHDEDDAPNKPALRDDYQVLKGFLRK
jgi:hypothetical protein